VNLAEEPRGSFFVPIRSALRSFDFTDCFRKLDTCKADAGVEVLLLICLHKGRIMSKSSFVGVAFLFLLNSLLSHAVGNFDLWMV
jgi:hypothetical protein